MRPPYPVSLVPLFPQFLQRRNTRLDFPLRAMERHGIDRPAYLFVVQSLGLADPAGATLAEVGSLYATLWEGTQAAAATAQGSGLVTHDPHGQERWLLTDAGRLLLDEHRRAVAAHHAALAPIDRADLGRLAALLDRAFAAGAAAAEPVTRLRTPRAHRYRWTAPASELAALDAAVFGLWQLRDDCHLQAWMDAGLTAPVLDVLTRLWRGEAATPSELAVLITGQRETEIGAAIAELRSGGLVEGDGLALTPQGSEVRERIESETNRYFFAPWPDDVGGQAEWIRTTLSRVNDALA